MRLYITGGFNVRFFIKALAFKKLKSYIEEKKKYRILLPNIYSFKKLKSYIEEKNKYRLFLPRIYLFKKLNDHIEEENKAIKTLRN